MHAQMLQKYGDQAACQPQSFHATDKVSQHLHVRVRAHEEDASERRTTGNRQDTLSRRAAFGAIGAAAAAVAAACGDSPTSRHRRSTTSIGDDDEHERQLRGHADRDDRTVSVAHRHVPQRHPREQGRDDADADAEGRQRRQQLRGGRRRRRRDLARRRRRRLLAIRIADGGHLPARHPDDQRRRRGDVHDDLPGLVSGTRHAHPRGSHDGRTLDQGDADCVPRIGEQRGSHDGRLRVAGNATR